MFGLLKLYLDVPISDLSLDEPIMPVIEEDNQTLVEGGNYRIRCTADKANPAADITWSLVLKSGQERVLNASKQEIYYMAGYYRLV